MNVVLDDDLIRKAQEITGIKTKKDVIHEALSTLIRLREQEQVRSLRGKLKEGVMQADFLSLLGGRKGHFKYESGYHGAIWLDLDAVFLRASQIQPFVSRLTEKLAQYSIDGVCGPVVGGAFLAQLIAAALDVDFYYAERFAPADPTALYGVQYRVPGAQRKLLAGKRVAIVDDVISAGSAVRGAFVDLQSGGAIPVVVGSLLLLGSAAPGFFAKFHIPVEAVERLDHDLWAPADCPLCAGQVALEDLTPDRAG